MAGRHRRRRRVTLPLTALGLAAVLLAAGCSSPPASGYVYSVNYNPPGSVYWPGHWYSSCSGSGSSRTCYQDYSPGWTQYIPAEWQIELCQQPGPPANANPCGWRDVDEQTYHSVRLGQWWTAVAGITPSATT